MPFVSRPLQKYSMSITVVTVIHTAQILKKIKKKVKFMKKHEIVRLKQVDHINGERNLMSQISHPFIVNMKGSFKDDRYVYIVMEVYFYFIVNMKGSFKDDRYVYIV